MKSIILQADSFCFGPASIAVAIAKELRKNLNNNIKLIGIGKGTTYELFSISNVLDEYYSIEVTSWNEYPNYYKKILSNADSIISVVDFNFAKLLSQIGLEIIFVDPLFWMWDKNPIRIDSCKKYFVLDFPGLKEKINKLKEKNSDDEIPIIVNAIRDNSTLSKVKNSKTKNSLLINFGGMETPFGYNIDLALTMTNCILEIVLLDKQYEEILICGGGKPIQYLKEYFGKRDNSLTIKAFPQDIFFEELASCRTFMSIPGLSIVYEAIYLSKVSLFLLPLNYSQHQQSAIYKKVLSNFYFISWDDLQGYEALQAGLPEEKGVKLAFQLGEIFSSDKIAQLKFKEAIVDFLKIDSPKELMLKTIPIGTETIKFDGATQIANVIISELTF